MIMLGLSVEARSHDRQERNRRVNRANKRTGTWRSADSSNRALGSRFTYGSGTRVGAGLGTVKNPTIGTIHSRDLSRTPPTGLWGSREAAASHTGLWGALARQARQNESAQAAPSAQEPGLLEYLRRAAGMNPSQPAPAQAGNVSGDSLYEAAALYGPALYEAFKKQVSGSQSVDRQVAPSALSTSQAVIGGVVQPAKPVRGLNPYHPYSAEQLAHQKAFFEGSFEGHPWRWWYDNYFTYFMGVFPFLFYAQYRQYPPLYYDFFDLVGEYPKQVENFDQYAAKIKPWPTVNALDNSSSNGSWSHLKERFNKWLTGAA